MLLAFFCFITHLIYLVLCLNFWSLKKFVICDGTIGTMVVVMEGGREGGREEGRKRGRNEGREGGREEGREGEAGGGIEGGEYNNMCAPYHVKFGILCMIWLCEE